MVTTAARDRLARVLIGDKPSAFTAEMTALPRCLTLEVEGYGPVELPVYPEQARELARLGSPARFGLGEQTLTDPSVRDTWEIPRHLVRARWDGTLARFLEAARVELGFPHGTELTAQLHSLLVYEEGQFFLPHQDSEKADNMVGTLVVTLPSNYRGGELVVEHQGMQRTFRTSLPMFFKLSLVAFFSDCRHEVKPVTSGHRITLTYNLMLHGEPSQPAGRDRTTADLAELLGEHFRTRAERTRRPLQPYEPPRTPSRLAFLLDHQYTARALDWRLLKGEDADRAALLRAAAEQAGGEAVLALADVQEVNTATEAGGWEGDTGLDHHPWRDENDDVYDVADRIDGATHLTHWTAASGGTERIFLTLDGSEVCASTPNEALAPYAHRFEPYTGNEGNTLDRWYHRGAVVVWPRELAFVNRAVTYPERALAELITMAQAGDGARARAAVATLTPRWTSEGFGGYRGEVPVDLTGPALEAAWILDGEQAAAQLLGHFGLDDIAFDCEHSALLARVAARYGEHWTVELMRGWIDQEFRRTSNHRYTASWLEEHLPEWCDQLAAEADGGALAASALRQAASTAS